jgi:hypothetical protein
VLIKTTSGLRKDQVQDIAPAIARLMLADGRAVLAFPDQFPAASEPQTFETGGIVESQPLNVRDILMKPSAHDQEIQAERLKSLRKKSRHAND